MTTPMMRVGKMSPAQLEDFRREYPFHVKYSFPDGRPSATNFELRWARAFYAKRGVKCVINKNSAYFQKDTEAVLFKMNVWMSPQALSMQADQKI